MSQWSGTRVDFIFSANGSPSNYVSSYIPCNVTDHYPIIIEISTRIKEYIKETKNMSRISSGKYVYNCQPIKPDAVCWVSSDKFVIRHDPYLTGNSSNMLLGTNGIYTAKDIKSAIYFGVQINRFIGVTNSDALVLFIFTKKEETGSLGLRMTGTNKTGIQKGEKDSMYDIIFTGSNDNRTVSKYTSKSFNNDGTNKFIELYESFFIIDCAKKITDDVSQIDRIKNSTEYIESVNSLTNKNGDINISTVSTYLASLVNTILHTMQYIEKKYTVKVKYEETNFLKNLYPYFSDDIRESKMYPSQIICIPFSVHETDDQQGGSFNHYKKYIKYKTKYVNLRDHRRLSK